MYRATPYFRTNFRSGEKTEAAPRQPQIVKYCYGCDADISKSTCNHTSKVGQVTVYLCCDCSDSASILK